LSCTTAMSKVVLDRLLDIIKPPGRRRVQGVKQQTLPFTSMRVHHLDVHGEEACSLMLEFDANPAASSLANQVARRAIRCIAEVMDEEDDVVDKAWEGPDGQNALESLLEETNRSAMASAIKTLSAETGSLLASQPTLLQLHAPAKVYGDLHGQFRDLLLLLGHFGIPTAGSGPIFIFNGDFVDRGAHQLEVVILLFALKLVFPDRVFLLRGNHEDAVQNAGMGSLGFSEVCKKEFGIAEGGNVFHAVHAAFNYLPLACVLNERILVLHAGIGTGEWKLDYLENLKRPMDSNAIAADLVINNILWSDPIADDGKKDYIGVHRSPRVMGRTPASTYSSPRSVRSAAGSPVAGNRSAFFPQATSKNYSVKSVQASPRADPYSGIVEFGKPVTEAFCKMNGIELLVRSHQIRALAFDVLHGGRCIRVFSARDYEGCHNDSSILSITHSADADVLIVRGQVLETVSAEDPEAGQVVYCECECSIA